MSEKDIENLIKENFKERGLQFGFLGIYKFRWRNQTPTH